VVASVFVLFLLLLSVEVNGDVRRCSGTNAVVDAQVDADFETTCAMARRTTDFMRRYGFDVSHELRIIVVDALTTHDALPVFGTFDDRSGDVTVLSFSASQKATKGRSIFGLEMNDALHQSFIAHEIAHAVAQKNFRISRPSITAHEYIAYTVQLATFPPPVRKQILEVIKVGAFENEHQIDETYLFLNPEYFAVKAYLHLMKAENGARFYKRVLSGTLSRNGDSQ